MNKIRLLFKNPGVLITLAALLVSVVTLAAAGYAPPVRSDFPGWLLVVGALWYIGVPLWFLIEWAWAGDLDKEAFERFKYTQGLARQFWLAVAAVLAFLIGVELK